MKPINRVLAIETSCDDTSVAVLRWDGASAWVEAVVSANQDIEHAPFGGIVPEVAGRSHTLVLLPLVEKALSASGKGWNDIDGIVVTNRPGLMGSLIVGVVTAKSLAMAKGIPVFGVNHLEGHILAPFLRDESYAPPKDFTFPFLALAVSGGHTTIYRAKALAQYEILGATLDDAAGEAFDKFAKLVGLGFPGGAKVDELAKQGEAKAFSFPRTMLHDDSLNMSFSGLKASAVRLIQSLSEEEVLARRSDLCASFQEAVVDSLLAKLDRAQQITGINKIVITGGVSANSRLRSRATEWATAKGLQLVMPPLRYCTDNAAMVGIAGIWRMQNVDFSQEPELRPIPHSLDGDFL